MNSQRRVLVVGPGFTVRGGITSVLLMHKSAEFWGEMRCKLLSTYDDRGAIAKSLAALKAYLAAPYEILRSRLVHVHLAGERSLLRKTPVIVLAKFMRRPVIVHVHAHSPESLFQRTPSWAVRYVLGGADRIIALSAFWAELIRERFPRASISVIPNPVAMYPPRVCVQAARPVILFVGKLEMRKGYLDLLDAAKLVLAEFPDAQFHFAGHGEIEKARRHARSLGIEASVHLPGWLKKDDLLRAYCDATVFCLPSHNEGVPMAALEAMSFGLPVVCTPVGGLPELIQDGANGFLAPPGDARTIADALRRLLRDQRLRISIGQAGQDSVRKQCGIDMVSDQIMDLYRRLLEPSPG